MKLDVLLAKDASSAQWRIVEVGESSRGQGNYSEDEDNGYHSEYPASGEDPNTHSSSSEDDMEVKKRKKKKALVYNPLTDHSEFTFTLGMLFINAE